MASTDATPQPKRAVAFRVTFPILNNVGSLVTAAAGLDSEISKDGGTFTDCTSEATEIATSSGVYDLDLTATEMTADTVAIIVKTTTTDAKTTTLVFYPADDGDVHVDVQMWKGTAVATPGTAGTPSVDITRIANAAVSTSTAQLGVNVVNAAGTAWGSGAITNASLAADAISASKVNADVGTEYATAILGTAVPGAFGAGTLGARIGRLPDVTAGGAGGVFIAGSNAATSITTALTANITGNLSGSVGSATVVNGLAANVITAAATATDFGTEIAAAVTGAAGADPAGVPAANASLLAKIDWLCAYFRNKTTVNRTTGVITLRNDTDTGTISTATASDDGTTFTRPEMT